MSNLWTVKDTQNKFDNRFKRVYNQCMKELKQKLTELNNAYWNTRNAMIKLGASKLQLERLSQRRRSLELALKRIYGDDLTKLNCGMEIRIKV